jgi:hypothetical protein
MTDGRSGATPVAPNADDAHGGLACRELDAQREPPPGKRSLGEHASAGDPDDDPACARARAPGDEPVGSLVRRRLLDHRRGRSVHASIVPQRSLFCSERSFGRSRSLSL